MFVPLWLTLLSEDAFAQQGDSVASLPPLSVSATRSGKRSPFELPVSSTRIVSDSARNGIRRNAIGEILFGVPGVQVQERSNPSQDPRLSIRGFGARSAFGVRGVRVLRDGVPLSLPDGQTPLDMLDVETVGTIEVIRGTAAALFGNAAGGVVEFKSRDIPDNINWRAFSSSGGGVMRANGTLSASYSDTERRRKRAAMLSITRTWGDGWRDWSSLNATSLFARAELQFNDTKLSVFGSHYDNARADNSGALTELELKGAPTLSDPLNVQKQSLKAVAHSQLAISVSRDVGDSEISATIFGSVRELDNPLPFSVVGVSRGAAGFAVSASDKWKLPSSNVSFRSTIGVDGQLQRDKRSNWENCTAIAAISAQCPSLNEARGTLRLSQREAVNGIGSYLRSEVQLPVSLLISSAVRYDDVRFRVRDGYVTTDNPDDSGERSMSAVTPMAGIVWRVRPLVSLFSNWSVAFETPAITELTNKSDGSAGLNDAILPQKTRTTEVGVRSFTSTSWMLEASAFASTANDELIPFDVPESPGRRAFRNAGKTSRRGVELAANGSLGITDVGIGYSWSRFRFIDYLSNGVNFAGNSIPGVPDHQLQLQVAPHFGAVKGAIEARVVSSVWADDANTVRASGYSVWNVRSSFLVMRGNPGVVTLSTGIDNVLDHRYASSVVTNATRGRYFEPGSVRTIWVGIELKSQSR